MKQPLSLEDIIEYELAYIENPNALIFLENPELFRSKPHPHTTSPFNSSSTNLPCFDSIFDKEMDKNSRMTKKVIKEEAIGYFSQEVSRTDWVDPKVLEIQFFLDENSIVDLLESPFNINKQGGHEGWVICSSGNDGRMCSQGQTKDIGKEVTRTSEQAYAYNDFLLMYLAFFKDLGIELPLTEFQRGY